MTDFWHTERPRSRTDRVCPECRETIPAGSVYIRHAGVSDGDMVSAFQCEACDAFAERYLASLRLSSCVNYDEVTYQFGALLDEAAEYTGYLWAPEIDGKSPAERRAAMLALLDAHDADERQYQEEQKARHKVVRDAMAARRARPTAPATEQGEG